MERNEGIVRWSPNIHRDQFMTFNLKNSVVSLYEATGHARPDRFDYKQISTHRELPQVNTYDWSPTIQGLVSVGTVQGIVNLLKVDDNSHDTITLPLKLQRCIQSVAFNTTGLLAVGLERVRNDSCLQIWDVNQRLADWDSKKPGWNLPTTNLNHEPKVKLEGSTSVSSIRFFEDQPQTLICGIKGQSVRVHDLRDPSSAVITFQTKCNNNIAIDWLDTNYFASSTLEAPGLVVWDRRAGSRASASPMYLEAFDDNNVPWGGVLSLKKVIEVKDGTFIKQLRYSKEERGLLGVLSTAGQLRTLQTNKDYIEPLSEDDHQDSPELVSIRKSWELEREHFNVNERRKADQRIVSFDWINIGTTDLQSRVIGLRANGEFEVLQMPATTATQLAQMIPLSTPYHVDDSYLSILNLKDDAERDSVIGPLITDAITTDVPPFGGERYDLSQTKDIVNSRVQDNITSSRDVVVDLLWRPGDPVPRLKPQESAGTSHKSYSSRELYSNTHHASRRHLPASTSVHDKLDHISRDRALAGYLFNCKVNKLLVSKSAADPWLQDVWEWIAGAEEAANEDGMLAGALDLSYMGVYTIWNHLLGEKAESRMIQGTIVPDESQWEHLICSINKRNSRPPFTAVKTTRAQSRQLCLAICGLLKSDEELEEDFTILMKEGNFTSAAAWALFQGLPKRAVDILNQGGDDLVFVAMAIDIKLQNRGTTALPQTAWGKILDENPKMANDPYLRAIYRYLMTGDWATVVDETSLPLRHRVGVALRNFSDEHLSAWLENEMEECITSGDIEGIVLAGITENMACILQNYVEKFDDYQTAILIMSFCYPRYMDDLRCDNWRWGYREYLNRHQLFNLRVKFDKATARKSRQRDGASTIKAPQRQVTVRCINCDTNAANDRVNTASGSTAAGDHSTVTLNTRNPLVATGVNAGLSCPRCGSHLPRCAICQEIIGVPRSDRPEYSSDPIIRRKARYPSFCLKCKHAQHMDHADAWFKRHMECPVEECSCVCNEQRRDPKMC